MVMSLVGGKHWSSLAQTPGRQALLAFGWLYPGDGSDFGMSMDRYILFELEAG